MTVIKPKILCTQCGTTLTQGDAACPSCGVALQWENGVRSSVQTPVLPVPEKKAANEKKVQGTGGLDVWSPKSVMGVIVVIACAVIAYEVITQKVTKTEPVSQPMSLAGENTQMQSALKDLEARVASNPEDMMLALQFANLLHDAAMYERAISYYKIYLEKNPRDADALVDLGICYKEIGDFIEAKKKMKDALKFVPKHLNAHFNLGIVCLNEGSLQESNEWFLKTVALDPASEVGKRAQQLLTQHNSQSPAMK